MIIVVPTLLETISSILVQIPDWVSNAKGRALELVGDNETLRNYIEDLTETFSVNLPEWIGENILGPKILGNVTGLSSFWVLFAIIFFGGKFGFIGMIIGVPVFAVIYDIVCKLVNKGVAYHKAQGAGE